MESQIHMDFIKKKCFFVRVIYIGIVVAGSPVVGSYTPVGYRLQSDMNLR